jgi:carbamoyl-phosphate synthase large subunit
MTHLTAWRDKKVLILGSGGLQIAQAGEFDYSGSQAIKALNQHQVKTILVNPNVATVQTDLADRTYLEPLTLEIAHQIIARERPDSILLSVGGQTALNLGLALHRQGILQKYNVSVLGTSIHAIEKTENRDSFNCALQTLNIKTAVSNTVSTVQDALNVAERIGYPVMMRIGFSLGGLGSGVVKTPQQLKKRAEACFHYANQILIEEYLSGWKEFEYEIIRDGSGNRLVICTMENMDPMGIHTGESIVVAPAQTLCDRQYHELREIALAVAQHFNIIGECNIQFAINPVNGDYRVIELNARLSRSSALASKATGYPLAFIATKLALGYRLHELKNTVTQKTCAFFEPALDYLVVKIPRWDTQKLKAADRHLGSEMKSVGEVMAIGRSFQEALQKAAGMLNIGASCLSDYFQIDAVEDEIANATDRRLFALYQYFRSGGTVEHAAQLSQIDPWFLTQICEIAQYECVFQQETHLNAQQLLQAKQLGFSDQVIARWFGVTEQAIRTQRLNYGITPYVKQIDTLAAEFAAETNYLYVTYHATEHDVLPHEGAVILLGSGVYAIGTSVEFDWCAVNTTRTLKELSQYSIVINSNPETVSTDYDESDRLYFEQLSLERVRDIADFEQPVGIIVSVGGQIANNLALPLSTYGYPLLGTSAQSIELAENRQKFSNLLMQLAINQPLWRSVKTLEQAKEFCDQVGYPVLIRPSYILSGAAMNVVYDESSLEAYLKLAMQASEKQAVVISQFVMDAKELEIDGVAQDGTIVISAISEHIENAGVHSGDATVVLPPQKLYLETIRRTKAIARTIVNALSITGPFNIQFIAKNNAISVIECNLRASRSLPFVSKATGYNFMRIATEVLLGKYTPKNYETLELDHVAVKAAKFSYARLKGSNPVAHVEMASTGEVACLADDFEEAFFKAWLATDQTLNNKNILLSISDAYKQKLLPVAHQLQTCGWSLYATEGTHHFLNRNQLDSVLVYKISQEQSPNIQTLIHQRTIGLIVNLPNNSGQNTDGFLIRRLAIDHHIPLVTNAQAALTLLHCLTRFFNQNLTVRSWQEFLQMDEKYFCQDRTALLV